MECMWFTGKVGDSYFKRNDLGTLRTLLFSSTELNNPKTYELLDEMANDDLFRKSKKYITKKNLGLLKCLLLKTLYYKKFRTIILLLSAMRFAGSWRCK